jgi:DNA repair photolyase
MAAIYEPKGAAREYSPLALNYINGCDHGCVYCYVPKIMKRFRADYVHSDVYIKEETQLLKEVLSSAKKHRNSKKQVFISFLTDPYSHFNKKTKLTRRVLEILLEYKIPVSILSKGGFNILEDLDIIKQFGDSIQVGGSLTFTSDKDSRKWEKHGASPQERFKTLEILHLEGIRTWASMEPVIYPDQSLEIMELTKDYIGGYKIGKLNHFPNHEKNFNWNQFLRETVEVMRKNNALFYIKEDLRKFKTEDIHLNPHEIDMDYMSLKQWENSETRKDRKFETV